MIYGIYWDRWWVYAINPMDWSMTIPMGMQSNWMNHTLWLCQNSYWKCTIYSGFTNLKWWFSIVMLVYQRVLHVNWRRIPLQVGILMIFDVCWAFEPRICSAHSAAAATSFHSNQAAESMALVSSAPAEKLGPGVFLSIATKVSTMISLWESSWS